MFYVKIENNEVSKYPYTFNDLRRDNPGTVFPTTPSDECLSDFGVYRVQESAKQNYNYMVQQIINTVVFENNIWAQRWVIENLPEEQAATNVRSHRNSLLSKTDWMALSDITPTQENLDYRQALRDVPQQQGFPYNVEWPIIP